MDAIISTSTRNNPRDLALSVLVKVDRSRTGTQEALSEALSKATTMSSQDRGLATELVYGVLRNKLRLDYAIHAASSHGVSKLSAHTFWALRIAAYQLGKLDRIPSHAAVNHGVRQVKAVAGKGLSGYANAVLRKIAVQWDVLSPPVNATVKSLSLRHSHPEWLIKKWSQRWKEEELEAVCAAYTEAAPVIVRVKPDAIAPVHTWLRENDVRWKQGFAKTSIHILGGVDPIAAAPFKRGEWIPQDEGSQQVVAQAQLKPGASVLEFCAGTGTKTTQILDAIGPEGTLVSLDISEKKLTKLQALVENWGGTVTVRKADGRRTLEGIQKTYDAVIVDAPCTGLGTVRRRPEIKWRRTIVDLRIMQDDQIQLLINAAQHVRMGGKLVYGVCSTTLDECEDVIEAFLNNHEGQFEICRPDPTKLAEFTVCDPRESGRDGFFVCVLRKTGL